MGIQLQLGVLLVIFCSGCAPIAASTGPDDPTPAYRSQIRSLGVKPRCPARGYRRPLLHTQRVWRRLVA